MIIDDNVICRAFTQKCIKYIQNKLKLKNYKQCNKITILIMYTRLLCTLNVNVN